MTLRTITLKMRGFVLGIFVSGQAEKQWDQYVRTHVHSDWFVVQCVAGHITY